MLYTSGYKLDTSNCQLLKTGSLNIKSIPKAAIVEIPELEIKEKTPALLHRLLPGNYYVTISKDTYHSWTADLLIEKQNTSFLDLVLLFKNDPVIENINTYPLDVVEKPSSEKIKTFNPETQQTVAKLILSNDLYIVSKNVPQITILDNTNGDLYLLSGNKLEATVKKIQSQPITEAIWHPQGYYVFYIDGPQVKAIETRITDKPNITTLYHGTAPENIQLNKKGTKLYLTENEQILELTIQ